MLEFVMAICIFAMVYSLFPLMFTIRAAFKEAMILTDFAYILAVYDLHKNHPDNWSGIQEEFRKYNKQQENSSFFWRWFNINFWRDVPKDVQEKYDERFGWAIYVIEDLARSGKSEDMTPKQIFEYVEKETNLIGLL